MWLLSLQFLVHQFCNGGGGGGGRWNQLCVLQAKLKGLLIWSNWAECAARTSCRKGCLTRSPKECWTYSFSLEDTPLALQLWALWLLWMHAATCLSARVSTNKEVASADLFLATAVCWIALASFSAPTWGKSLKCLGLSFSFSVLGCCGGWWFLGAGMEGPFFATGPVAQWERPCHWCARRRCFVTVYKDWRLESSPDPCLRAQVFSGVVLWSWGGFWPFMNIWQKNWRCHILPSSPPSSSTTSIILKKHKACGCSLWSLQSAGGSYNQW